MLRENNFNFSFSGLKTAVINHIRVNGLAAPGEEGTTAEDVAAAFQEAVADVLTEKTLKAAEDRGARYVWLGGGVAANKRLRERLNEESLKRGFGFFSPAMTLCTDNAGMIAKAGYEIYARGGELPGLLANPSMGLQSV
jgi:N6-L-threonylcarbamoyladenine synthase